MSLSTTEVDELTAAVDKLVAMDPAVLADGEAVVGLHRQLERVTAAVTRATGSFDASAAWEPDGARTTAAWLATRCRMPQSTARRRVRLARALRHLPTAETAWLAGEIGEAQVNLLAGARTPGTAEALARDEAMLVGEARRLRFASFARVLAYWGLHADHVGVARRLFSGATRRAVEIRDRECFHEFCDTPASECDIDHVQPWAAGGPTTQENGRPACGFHNRARQQSP